MAALPRAHEALVERRKLEEYVLCPTHEVGRHKARMFRVLLGIGQDDWRYLREKLLDGLLEATDADVRVRKYGFLAAVRMGIEGLNGARRTVTTVWEVRNSDTRPRLITAYIEE